MTAHRHKNAKGIWVTTTDGAHTHPAEVTQAEFDALAARVAALETTTPPPPPPPPPPPSTFPTNLQAAIDAAPVGSTIDVTGGPIYNEKIIITKKLTLIGARVSGLAFSSDQYA